MVRTFDRQIAAGEPVTVTHLEARRCFMTIPEAVQQGLPSVTLVVSSRFG